MLLTDAPPGAKEEFTTDLALATDEVQQGITNKCSKATIEHWLIWAKIGGKLATNYWLCQCTKPVPILQVFMCRGQDG
jgi:hypothetical protein